MNERRGEAMATDPAASVKALGEGRRLARALLLEARSALRPHDLSAADREDLEQLVVIAALRRFHTYREEAGTVRQWIRGIARNEVRALRRREPGAHLELGEATSVASRAASVEEAASQRDLLDHLLAQIPLDQRRIVILVEMWGLTIREAAAVVRSSPTRVHARHQAGMAALREAAERWREEQERHGAVALPLPPAALFTAALPDEAPTDADERAWRLAIAALGLDQAAPARRIGARTANDDRPTGGRSAARWPERLGLLLLGPVGFAAGALIARAPQERRPAMTPTVMVATIPTAIPDEAPAAQLAPPAATAVSVTTATPVAAKALRARTVARAPRDMEDDALRAERALVDRGRAALSAGNVASALDALAEHARRFPDGQSAGTRERLRAEACAEARVDARCAGRR